MLRTPIIRLTADNEPLDDAIMSRLMDLSVTDNKSGDADELSLTLDDHDGKLAMPKRGVKLQCWMGYIDAGVHDMGIYTVDSVEWGGTPDTITVKAKSADMKGSLKSGRTQSYHDKKLGEIAKEVATRHELELAMTDYLMSIEVGHIDQTDESDLHLLTRLCWQFGAVVNVKHGKLLIFQPYENKTVSGQPLTLTVLKRDKGDQFRFSIEDRQGDVDNVQATYHDAKQAKKVTVNTDKDGQKPKRLKGNFKDEKTATAAANAEKKRIEGEQGKFSINCAFGYPAISTESPIELQGFKVEIDSLKWTVDKATHSYSKSQGLTTQLDLTTPINGEFGTKPVDKSTDVKTKK